MKLALPQHKEPRDAKDRRSKNVVVCYPLDTLPDTNLAAAVARRTEAGLLESVVVLSLIHI